jgi:hypothetical protein
MGVFDKYFRRPAAQPGEIDYYKSLAGENLDAAKDALGIPRTQTLSSKENVSTELKLMDPEDQLKIINKIPTAIDLAYPRAIESQNYQDRLKDISDAEIDVLSKGFSSPVDLSPVMSLINELTGSKLPYNAPKNIALETLKGIEKRDAAANEENLLRHKMYNDLLDKMVENKTVERFSEKQVLDDSNKGKETKEKPTQAEIDTVMKKMGNPKSFIESVNFVKKWARKKDIPGVTDIGILGGIVPKGAKGKLKEWTGGSEKESKAADELQQRVDELAITFGMSNNPLAKGNPTETEREKILSTYGLGRWDGESSFRSGVQRLINDTIANLENVARTDPDAYALLLERGVPSVGDIKAAWGDGFKSKKSFSKQAELDAINKRIKELENKK